MSERESETDKERKKEKKSILDNMTEEQFAREKINAIRPNICFAVFCHFLCLQGQVNALLRFPRSSLVEKISSN